MLLDFGWSEILLIGVVALVVIGPKDLPKAMRVAGYWMRKARSISHDFQMQVEEMMRESELDEVRDELKKASEIDLRETIDPDGSLAESIKPPELPDLSQEPRAEGEAGTDEKPAEAEGAVPSDVADAAPAETEVVETEVAEPAKIEPTPSEAAPNGAEPTKAEPSETAPHEIPAKPAAAAPAGEHAAPPKPSQ